MSSSYRTRPQVKFAAFRDLERRRVQASDTVWAVLVGSKLASASLTEEPDRGALLAVRYPALPHVERMNQRVGRAAELIDSAEDALCTMAFGYVFALHEDFLRTCMDFLVAEGKATRADASENAVTLHETFEQRTGHVFDGDARALFHLTRALRNAHMHAAGRVRPGLVEQFNLLTASQRQLWKVLTREELRVPEVGETAAFGVGELVGALAVQKRLAYDVNLALQKAISRATWADMVAADYVQESGKSLNPPTALRSLRGYTRGGYAALELTDDELSGAIDRWKKSGAL